MLLYWCESARALLLFDRFYIKCAVDARITFFSLHLLIRVVDFSFIRFGACARRCCAYYYIFVKSYNDTMIFPCACVYVWCVVEWRFPHHSVWWRWHCRRRCRHRRYKIHLHNGVQRNQSEMRRKASFCSANFIAGICLSPVVARKWYAKNHLRCQTGHQTKAERKTKMDCRMNAKLPSFSWYFNACVRFEHVINLHAMTLMQQRSNRNDDDNNNRVKRIVSVRYASASLNRRTDASYNFIFKIMSTNRWHNNIVDRLRMLFTSYFGCVVRQRIVRIINV